MDKDIDRVEYFLQELGIGFDVRSFRPGDHPKAQIVLVSKCNIHAKIEGHAGAGYMVWWYFDKDGKFLIMDVGT